MLARKRGFTLVELMVVVSIIILVAAVASSGTGRTLQRNQLNNQLRWMKASFVNARAKAIEFTAPVRFSFTAADNAILVARDADRDGDFLPEFLILGNDLATNTGVSSPYKKVIPVLPGAEGIARPPHWSGLASQGDVDVFPDDELILLPDGRVMSGSPLQNVSGTYFFKTALDDYFGLVHITSMGEVKLAVTYEKGNANAWSWID